MNVLVIGMSKSHPYYQNLYNGVLDDETTIEVVSADEYLPLLQAIRRDSDICHIHWAWELFSPGNRYMMLFRLHTFLIQLMILKIFRIKTVWTAHDKYSLHGTNMQLERIVKHVFVRWGCHRVIVHCDRSKDILLESYNLPDHLEDRFVNIPHGPLAPDMQRPDTVTECDTNSNGLTYLFFGKVREYKGVTSLVTAFKSVSADEDHLMIVGKPWPKEYGEQVKRLIGDSLNICTQFEHIPEDEIEQYFNRADVVVLPFERILTSGTAILAMEYGKPLVVPNKGCPPELIGESGGITYSEGELETALREIKNINQHHAGLRNQRAISELEWKDISKATLDLYNDISN